ncbi:MAG: hypothetical protein HOQ05_02905 [Corynebacteriales bacterium]|nr:hypothetical protein [Mycobacteriales bacterium]
MSDTSLKKRLSTVTTKGGQYLKAGAWIALGLVIAVMGIRHSINLGDEKTGTILGVYTAGAALFGLAVGLLSTSQIGNSIFGILPDSWQLPGRLIVTALGIIAMFGSADNAGVALVAAGGGFAIAYGWRAATG